METLQIISCVLVFSRLASAIYVTGTDPRAENFVSRCVTRHADYMNITCPHHYVMLTPKVLAGHSDSGTCVYNKNDCLGTSLLLSKESQACANQESCSIRLRRVLERLTPLPGHRKACKGKPLTYVSVKLPLCVPKDSFHAMCLGGKALPIVSRSGIIDSSYIQAHNSRCTRRFGNTAEKVRLTLTFLDIHVTNNNRPKIVWTSDTGKLRKRTFKKQSVFSETGSKFEIEWRPKSKELPDQGFVASYDVKLIGENQLRLANDQPRNVPVQTPVHATLQNEMIRTKPSQITMSCPQGGVIYAPDINLTSSSQPGCTGLSPHLLVQRNECYWRRNCTMNWNGPAFFTMTSSPRCFGRTGDHLRSGGHQCITEDNIINMCDTSPPRRLKSAMVRSHEKYPWHYPRENKKCRLRVKIGGRQLKLKVDYVDIDDEKDSLVIKHFRGKNGKVIFSGNGENFVTVLKGGSLEIVMSIKQRTKSGSGFVLHYERLPRKSKGRRRKGKKRHPKAISKSRHRM